MKITKDKIAIVILAYSDFEAFEIALAAYSAFITKDMNIYILQNGLGTYDTERTYRVAKRYASLFPENIKVIDNISPGAPYISIKTLLNSDEFKKYDYICKVDDDAFPLTPDWFDNLITCYENSYEKFGDKLAYVTSLVNNNPWGFKEILTCMNLQNKYLQNVARTHTVGSFTLDTVEPRRLANKDEIYTGAFGTVWENPYISRWLHLNTTLKPLEIINSTNNLQDKEINNNYRYSINCMLFKKEFWNNIYNGSTDDELSCLLYCRNNDKKIIANLSNPFIHLCFFSQREENKDLMPLIRTTYEKYLNLPYPISICPLKEYENENRLRYIENKLKYMESNYLHKKKFRFSIFEKIFSIKNNETKQHKIITLFGIKIKLKYKK